MPEKEDKRDHDKWLDELEKEFNDDGFTTIREGKMFLQDSKFLSDSDWHIPDLFVLHGAQLILVLEVIVEPAYKKLLDK